MNENKICNLCKHSLEDNLHGADQNDFVFDFADGEDKLIYLGSCTYCKECRKIAEEMRSENE